MIEDLDFQNVATVLHFEELAEVAGRLACTEPDLPALPIGLDQKNLRFGLRRPRCSRGATRAGPAPRSGSTKPSLPRPPAARPATPNLLALPPFLKKGIDTLKDQWVDARTGG